MAQPPGPFFAWDTEDGGTGHRAPCRRHLRFKVQKAC